MCLINLAGMLIMKKSKAHLLLAMLFSSLLFLLSAEEARALSIHVNASNAGLKLHYDFKRLGSDNITIAPGDSEKQLLLKGIVGDFVQLWIRVDSVDADKPVPVVNTVIITSVMGEVSSNEFPLALPFGDYGLEADLFKRIMWKTNNAPIEISLLCTPLRTKYDITLNLGQQSNNTYKGSATLLNKNVIHEKIPLNGNNMTANRSIDLTIIPVKTIPVTFFMYSWDVYDDNNSLIQSFSGVIPLPNGIYLLWLNPGFDINNIFIPQTQACCAGEDYP